jgi:hypothetical protein
MLEPLVPALRSGTGVPGARRDTRGDGVEDCAAPGVLRRTALDDEWPRRGTR